MSSLTTVFAGGGVESFNEDPVVITSDERAITASYIEDGIMYVVEVLKDDLSMQYYSQPLSRSGDANITYYDLKVETLDGENIEFVVDDQFHYDNGEYSIYNDDSVAFGPISVPAGWVATGKLLEKLAAAGILIVYGGYTLAEAAEIFLNLDFDKYQYFRAMVRPSASIQTRPMTLYVGEGIHLKGAKIILQNNNSDLSGVMAATKIDAQSLVSSIGGYDRYERHCKHEYYNAFYHYHPSVNPDKHLWHY